MQSITIRDKILLAIIICLILISYATGFILRENSAGGAIVDFENVKRNLLAFKNNSFFEAIKLTATKDTEIYQSTRAPGFYVFNKYLNPFTDNVLFFQGYITIFSLLIPILLFLNLKIKFKETNTYFLIFTSSLILLSPYLRSSAFWGIEENFGIVMVGFSALFYQLYKETKSKNYELIYLIFLALFSSLCVYFDQKLIIIPFISLVFVMILKKKIYNKLFLIFLYIIFSLPFLYLIRLWGNITPTGDGARRGVDILSLNLNYHYIGYSISIIAFYLFPFFFILKDNKKKIFYLFKNKVNYLYIIFFIFYLFFYLFYYDLGNFFREGGGVFQKLTGILFDSLLAQKIILSLIFLFSWILILVFSNKNLMNFLVLGLLPFLSVLITPALFQEYFDPLIYFLILIYLKNEYSFNFKRCIFLFSYFTIFLSIGIIYYK
jgi:hypothetical protein|tara:strand:+ start:794 stop:2098 length:1305 start_codon:yes stop_codon:yes gene_type:complete